MDTHQMVGDVTRLNVKVPPHAIRWQETTVLEIILTVASTEVSITEAYIIYNGQQLWWFAPYLRKETPGTECALPARIAKFRQ